MLVFLRQICFTLLCLVVSAAVLKAGPQTDVATQPPATISPDETVDLGRFAAPAPEVSKQVSMTHVVLLLTGYSVLIVAASLAGGWLPSKIRLTHTRMQTVISLVGGLMLGIGVFHLLPHAFRELHSPEATARWMMLGIVIMFVLMRLFHFHNHEPVGSAANEAACDHSHTHDHDHGSGIHATGEGHSAAECHTHGHVHGISWMGIALGLSLHTLIDGIALGASVYSHAQRATGFWLFGFGTFLAIVFHKPLDAVSVTSLMVAGGWSRRARNLVNTGFAMMCPLGAALALLLFRGVSQFSGYQQEMVGTALAFAAGVFICISLSDLLPEMEFHSHNRVQLTVALGLGIAIAWLMTLLHPAHL